MNREELIEEATIAMSRGYVKDGRISSFFELAEIAFAVFEKTQCKRCGKVAEGYAFIGDDRYCHPDDGVDCYTLASHELTSLANQAFIEKAQAPTDEEREALSNFLFSVYEHGSQPNALREADAILSFLASIRPAQTEPTDAQVLAALNTLGGFEDTNFGGFTEEYVNRMRAALRAAFTAGQEDKP